MPIYEYRCKRCNHRFEVLQKLGEDGNNLECPECQTKNPERVLSVFSGGGSEKCSPTGNGSKFT